MTATLAGSTAILKRKYPKGAIPQETYSSFQNMAMMKKSTDFVGEDEAVVLQTENPQGIGASIADAQASMEQGSYKRFLLTRVELFGVARIKGQAHKAAVERNDGSLVDLWNNETRGIETSLMKDHEIYSFGNGSGVRGQLNAGVVSGTTVTLLTPEDAVNFDLNMWVQAVSDSTLSPTTRSGKTKITGIDRKLGVLTTSANWNAQIPAIGVSDYLVRASTGASGGTAVVPNGYQSWIVGGATPGTFLGLDRNTDPVRLSGQTTAYAAGTPIEEALVDADSQIGLQWMSGEKRVVVMNNRDVANLKKQLGTKVQYDRVKSNVAGISFKTIEVEGETGPIAILANPFCPRRKAFMLTQSSWEIRGLGPVPQLQDFDKNDFLRVATDDAVEARFCSYSNTKCTLPVAQFLMTNVGA